MHKRIERKLYSHGEREEILNKTNHKCAHCGMLLDTQSMTVEHIVPVSKGGTDAEYNIVALCEACNNEKSNWVYSDIKAYYHYIDAKYNDLYEIEHLKQLENIRSHSLFKANSQVFKMVSTKCAIALIGKSFKGCKGSLEDKLNKLRDKIAINMRLELAYSGDAEAIAEFLKKQHRNNNISCIENAQIYMDPLMIRLAMKNGEVYVLYNPANEICGVLILEGIDYQSGYLPQLDNILIETNRSVKYVVTLYEISNFAAALYSEVINTAIEAIMKQGYYPIFANILSNIYVFKDNILRLPYNIHDSQTTLEILNIKGLKRHFRTVYRQEMVIKQDVSIDELVDYTLDMRDGISDEKYELIRNNIEQLGKQRFMKGERVGA